MQPVPAISGPLALPPATFHLAQVNIAIPRAPLDSALLADFMAALDPINALADANPGFVWRLQAGDGNATTIRAFDDDRLIVNLSVWQSLDALRMFAFTGAHAAVMRRRREWFERMAEAHTALWWVPAGHIPNVSEAEARLRLLREHGPSPAAFTFQKLFASPPTAEAV